MGVARFLVLLVLVVAQAACQPDPSPATIELYQPGPVERILFPEKRHTPPSTIRPRRHVPIPTGALETVSIKLSRGGCFGTCPIYKVELRGDGQAIYEGGCFTLVPGRRVYKVSPEAVAKLVERFRAADFWSLEPSYRAQITDSPTYWVTLSIGGQTRTVEDYIGKSVGMPPEVAELEAAIDDAAGSPRWTIGDDRTITDLAAGGFQFKSAEGARMLALARWQGRYELAQGLKARGAPEPSPNAGLICDR